MAWKTERNTDGNEIGEFDEFIATFNPDINEGFFPRSKAGSAPLVAVDEKQAELDLKYQYRLGVSRTGEPATANTTMYVNVTKDDNNQLVVQELEPIDDARQVLVGLTFRSPTSTGDSISNIITKTLLYPNEAGEFKVGSNFELDLVDFSDSEDA